MTEPCASARFLPSPCVSFPRGKYLTTWWAPWRSRLLWWIWKPSVGFLRRKRKIFPNSTRESAEDLPTDLYSVAEPGCCHWTCSLAQVVWDNPFWRALSVETSVNYKTSNCSAEHAIQAGFSRCLQIYIMFFVTEEKRSSYELKQLK